MRRSMRRTFTAAAWLVSLSGGAVFGCGDDEPGQPSGPPDAGGHDAGGEPGLPELGPEWTAIEPGGDTICSRETPFRFFVRGGRANKLAIVFDGGGACWNASTCGIADMIFSPEAEESLPEPPEGISDTDDEENPLRDYYAVFIPYCTGDVHWGNNVQTYPGDGDAPDVTIHHKGRINAQAALDWVYQHFERPETIFVTGFSAGAYGSIAHAPYVMDHYRDSRVVQLGDCGAGVITDTFFEDSFPSWHAQEIFPEWIEGLQRPLSELAFEDMYIEIGNAYPHQVVGQYTTYNDENQRFYYTAMGGADDEWAPAMLAKIEAIEQSTPNFRYYVAWGEKHVLLPYPEFYTYQVDGVRMRDWLADLLEGRDVDNVRCTDCTSEELYQP